MNLCYIISTVTLPGTICIINDVPTVKLLELGEWDETEGDIEAEK